MSFFDAIVRNSLSDIGIHSSELHDFASLTSSENISSPATLPISYTYHLAVYQPEPMAPDSHSQQPIYAPEFLNPPKPHGATFPSPHSHGYSPLNPPAAVWPSAQPTPHTKQARLNTNSPRTISRPSKRKARDNTRQQTKKPKTHVPPKNVSDEDFRTSETQQLDMPQAVGIMNAQIPLSNIERWRLRGWAWPQALMPEPVQQRHSGHFNDDIVAESPTGTTFLEQM
jgi:hypothetical protein